MLCSLATAVVLFLWTPLGAHEFEGVRLLLIIALSTIVWLGTTMLTSPTPQTHLRIFYERIRPGGFGWRPIENKFGLSSGGVSGLSLLGAMTGAAFIYTSLFGLGKFLLGFPASTWAPLALTALCSAAIMLWCLKD